MLSRLIEADGTPRDRALWLVLAGMVASLLLAFWVVCVHQVQRAQERHALGRQAVLQPCSSTRGGFKPCGNQTAEATGGQMSSSVR